MKNQNNEELNPEEINPEELETEELETEELETEELETEEKEKKEKKSKSKKSKKLTDDSKEETITINGKKEVMPAFIAIGWKIHQNSNNDKK
ncbi:MAG: hypothetical protein H7836_14090 [Magnetococcus sp. YQC-3]